MRVGWKVHRLTLEEIVLQQWNFSCINSTFPDTNCIVFFQINPHWICNSGMWKLLLEAFRRCPGKLTKGVLFHQDNAPAHKSLVALAAAVHDCGFELVDHHPPYSDLALSDYFQFPNMKKKHLARKQNWTGDEHISAELWGPFFRIRMRASIPQESKCCNTARRSVWTAGETIFKNKPHLVKFNHCIIVSLWTFQPTLIYQKYILMLTLIPKL